MLGGKSCNGVQLARSSSDWEQAFQVRDLDV